MLRCLTLKDDSVDDADAHLNETLESVEAAISIAAGPCCSFIAPKVQKFSSPAVTYPSLSKVCGQIGRRFFGKGLLIYVFSSYPDYGNLFADGDGNSWVTAADNKGLIDMATFLCVSKSNVQRF